MFANRLILPTFLVVSLLVAPAGQAGVIAPGLEALLAEAGADDPVKVLVVLDHQADIPALDRNLRGAKASLPQRHRLVVESLRAAADASQSGLLADLAAKSASGRVFGFVPHWLINSVVVTATPAAVRDLAARPDVARVEPDLVVSMISPLPGTKNPPAFADSVGVGVGVTPGVQAVGAPRVWREFGIDGTGTIVGTMDSGVDGTHPALVDRWRGNFAPASECWIDAAGTGDTSFPIDRDISGHGTHVMGTVTGLALGDTIGVAPGALWIAANTIVGGLSRLDNAVMASLEFMTDPDGDPTTSGDVPDVVQNSWGVSEVFDGYFECDSRWWDAIDNCEAAGVVLTWSAGNEGPSLGTMRSPADRASTPLNCFSVGSTLNFLPHEISEFSSRGPSGCGGAFEIKPEIVAPGTDIYSAGPEGGYRVYSGTSMAGPHVAGVVALMRQANPDLDVTSIKEILMDTAIDLGDPGQDNAYGHGFIDAYAAVAAVLDQVGTVNGTVTDQATGLPVAGATVMKQGGYNSVVTDENGDFSLTMVSGPASFLVSRFGYFDGGFSATITPGGVSTHSVQLYLKPTATISGLVAGPDGQPVVGATVTPLDVPVTPAVTDAAGWYELVLPNGPGVIYDLVGNASGLGFAYQSVELVADLSVDFHLPEQFVEDFETGDFTSFPWQGGGNAPWTIDAANSHEGAFSARSGVIRNDESSVLELDYYVSVDSYLQFWTKVSSEYFYDYLLFFLDDVLVAYWSGERDWSQFRTSIPRGHHNFKWVYQRDVAYREGEDAAWLDFVEFPTTGEELFPTISLDVASLPASVAAGDTMSLPVTISNVGDWTLDFSIKVGDVLKSRSTGIANPVPHLEGSKGAGRAAETKLALGPPATAGGPDAYGYQWMDSDHLGGPVYAWVDISATGTVAGTGDEAILGPFPLGFDFRYYEYTYDSVRVSSNGFLTFTSPIPAFQNQGIPDPFEPNNLLAVFWDDLNPDGGGTIYYKSEPENDRFIVQYDQVVRFETSAPETFQVILYRDGTILYQYADVEETGSCTVGIENKWGDDGLLVAYNFSDYPRDGLAILFDRPVIIATVTPTQGQIAPGSSVPVAVLFDATVLEPGFYVAVMAITSTDPTASELLVPLMLTVTSVSDAPAAVPRTVTFAGPVPNPFNPSTLLKFSLPSEADVKLDLYDVSGRRVRSLVTGRLPAGPHAVPWNGKDEAGRNVASGTYFVRLMVAGVSSVKPVTLIR